MHPNSNSQDLKGWAVSCLHSNHAHPFFPCFFDRLVAVCHRQKWRSIAKPGRSRPRTKSTKHQMKVSCNFKFSKHHEDLIENIWTYHGEKKRFKGRLNRLKRLVYCRNHWMPLVVNRVGGVVTRSLVQCSHLSPTASLQHSMYGYILVGNIWVQKRWTVNSDQPFWKHPLTQHLPHLQHGRLLIQNGPNARTSCAKVRESWICKLMSVPTLMLHNSLSSRAMQWNTGSRRLGFLVAHIGAKFIRSRLCRYDLAEKNSQFAFTFTYTNSA